MLKNELLTRYWFEFEKNDDTKLLGAAVLSGCGVTAYSYDQAITMLQENVFNDSNLPPLIQVIENVDITTLDQNHVVPNIGDVTRLGIWWPIPIYL